MRKFLYSRWFFGFLALVLAFDLAADVFQEILPGRSHTLDYIAIAADAVGVSMALWMFVDLSRRRPRRGSHTPG